MTWYGVTSSFDDDGKTVVNITTVIDTDIRPKNTFTHTSRKDIYVDWFSSKSEALKWCKSMKQKAPR